MSSSRDGRDGADLGGLESSEDVRTAQLNQVVNYSEFLHELAAQRHSVVKSYLGTSVTFVGYSKVKERSDDLLVNIDALITRVLNHVEGNGLVATDSPNQDKPVESAQPVDRSEDKA